MINAIQTTLAVIFVFGLLIASHEIGHFVVAKLSGVKVLEFALGMGPKLFSFVRGETRYSLRLLPIGGYVKMLGEEDESSDPRAFCNKSPWKRIPIIIAGAFMNFVVAVLLFTIVLYNTGIPTAQPIIGQLESGYPALTAGLQANDRILSVNNENINKWDDFVEFVQNNKDKPFNLTVMRNSKSITFNIKSIYDTKQSMYRIGVSRQIEKGNLFLSLKNGFLGTFSAIGQMINFLGGIFKGKMSLNDVGGPVAIVKMTGDALKVDFWTYLSFAGFLSINLGVFNLIPFPALDGGWVVILLLEGISGKKIDENKIGIINLIGFAVLIGFAILVTFKDVLKLGSY